MPLELTSKTKLLFVGDSITDCGRQEDAEGIGLGYVRLIRDYLLARNPFTSPVITNAGVGGDRIVDLKNRWEQDVITRVPDVVSIKIGVNDVWYSVDDGKEGIAIEQFVATYREILQHLRQRVPWSRIILCEPSVIWPPAPAKGNEMLAPYVRAVNDLAIEFRALAVVPLHGAFNLARKLRPDVSWTEDGVHPTSAGHMLIARTWLATMGLL